MRRSGGSFLPENAISSGGLRLVAFRWAPTSLEEPDRRAIDHGCMPRRGRRATTALRGCRASRLRGGPRSHKRTQSRLSCGPETPAAQSRQDPTALRRVREPPRAARRSPGPPGAPRHTLSGTDGRSGHDSPAPDGGDGRSSDGSSQAGRRIHSFRYGWSRASRHRHTTATVRGGRRGGRCSVSLIGGKGGKALSFPPHSISRYSLLKGVKSGLYSPKRPLGFGYQIHTWNVTSGGCQKLNSAPVLGCRFTHVASA